MSFIDKLAFIYIKDKKVLATRSSGKTAFYIPGGKREGNETDLEALKREIFEELSVKIIDTSIKYYGTFEAQAHGKPEGTLVRMTCYFADFVGEFEASSEIEELGWLFSDDINSERTSIVDWLILDALLKDGLIS